MELICKNYTFYTNGIVLNRVKYDRRTRTTEGLPEYIEPQIKIFGTLEQVQKAFEEYEKATGLNLNEKFTIKEEPKFHEDGELNYHYKSEKENERTKRFLQSLHKEYKENGNKTIII
tara:strand:- start:36 stop:386 length:351 start_codon:yes stop_codon:yes gene_type:complete